MAPRGQNRSRLIGAMRELTLRRGYAATGVDDVCESAGVSKGSFYHHFSGKEGLALAAVDAYVDDLTRAMSVTSTDDAIGDAPDVDDGPVGRLRRFLARVRELTSGPLLVDGCLLGVLTLDAAATHPELRHEIAVRFERLIGGVTAMFEAAFEGTEQPITSAALARQLVIVLEGSILLDKAGLDGAVPATALDVFVDHIERLLTEARR